MALLLRSLYFYFASSVCTCNLDMPVLDLYAVLQLY